MRFLQSFLVLSIFILLTSCEEEYVFTKEKFVPKIVVNSVFTENNPFNVHLSFSRDILSNNNNPQFISNAVVTIKETATGRTEELPYKGDGNYSYTFFTPKIDFTYELTVNVPGHKVITAKSKVPLKVSNVDINTENIIHQQQEAVKINFNISDKNQGFFVWNWFQSNKQNPIDSIGFATPEKLLNSTGNIRNVNLNDNDQTNVISKDTNIEYKTSFVIDGKKDGETDPGTPEAEEFYLRIVSLSKEMYEFYISLEKYIDEDGQISSLSYLPKVFSNVNNGLGLFAGYSQRYIEVKK